MRKKIICTVAWLAVFISPLMAQPRGKEELEKERRQLQAEIKEMQDVYSRLKKETTVSAGQAKVLGQRIHLQEQLISSLNNEIRFIDDDMYRSNMEIYRLGKQLDTLKNQYVRSVVYAYKNRTNYDFLNFIFSADHFNDALKRISYLKSYRAYRQRQVENIRETKRQIEIKRQQQEGKKLNKMNVAKTQEEQVKELEDQKKEKDQVVAKLKLKEGDLRKQLAAKQKRDRLLKNQITALIEKQMEQDRINAQKEREAAKARLAALNKENAVKAGGAKTTKAKEPAAVKTTPGSPVVINTKKEPAVRKEKQYATLPAADLALGATFKENRGRMPWPVDRGFVCTPFGPYKDEATGAIGLNPGLTICTSSPGAPVKSIFTGVVTNVFNIDDVMVVMIKHGNYFSVYSNLASVDVSKGSAVSTGQVIGKVGKSEDGDGGSIDLILMNERTEMNPAVWLRR